MDSLERTKRKLEKGADKATRWIGSTKSLVVHTLLFLAALILPVFGIPFERVLLVLTTFLSLEAIYLAIFIQMTVNKNTADIEDIQEDVEEIQKDIEEQTEEEVEERTQEKREHDALLTIQATLAKLSSEIDQIKKK